MNITPFWKAFLVATLWSLLFASLGDLAEYYVGWDAMTVRVYLLGMAFLWVLDDLYHERARLALIREKAEAVVRAHGGRR